MAAPCKCRKAGYSALFLAAVDYFFKLSKKSFSVFEFIIELPV